MSNATRDEFTDYEPDENACRHPDCRSARAAELAAQGRTLAPTAEIRCRRPREAGQPTDGVRGRRFERDMMFRDSIRRAMRGGGA